MKLKQVKSSLGFLSSIQNIKREGKAFALLSNLYCFLKLNGKFAENSHHDDYFLAGNCIGRTWHFPLTALVNNLFPSYLPCSGKVKLINSLRVCKDLGYLDFSDLNNQAKYIDLKISQKFCDLMIIHKGEKFLFVPSDLETDPINFIPSEEVKSYKYELSCHGEKIKRVIKSKIGLLNLHSARLILNFLCESYLSSKMKASQKNYYQTTEANIIYLADTSYSLKSQFSQFSDFVLTQTSLHASGNDSIRQNKNTENKRLLRSGLKKLEQLHLIKIVRNIYGKIIQITLSSKLCQELLKNNTSRLSAYAQTSSLNSQIRSRKNFKQGAHAATFNSLAETPNPIAASLGDFT